MNTIWNTERRLWVDGVAAYEELMTKDCIMVFGPMGIMTRSDVIESLKQAPRWSRVTMSAETQSVYGKTAIVLAYLARAEREGGERYEAFCSSSYVLEGEHWRIAQHQQTPI